MMFVLFFYFCMSQFLSFSDSLQLSTVIHAYLAWVILGTVSGVKSLRTCRNIFLRKKKLNKYNEIYGIYQGTTNSPTLRTPARAPISVECRILALCGCTKLSCFNLKYCIDCTSRALWDHKLQSIIDSQCSSNVLTVLSLIHAQFM